MAKLRNFPHQFADFRQIRRALSTYLRLKADSFDTSDDAVYGYALARDEVYKFRGFDYSDRNRFDTRLEQRITSESNKRASNQGARTAARELRRTLQHLGFVDSKGEISLLGDELLTTSEGSQDEKRILGTALLSIRLSDNIGSFSPVVSLLKLIKDRRFSTRDGMELALSPDSDSLESYEELTNLFDASRVDRLASIQATVSQAKNSVKVIPSLAIYAGLVEKNNSEYRLTHEGNQAIDFAVNYGSIGQGLSTKGNTSSKFTRRKSLERQTSDLLARHSENSSIARTRTPMEQIESSKLLIERTNRHQELVRQVAQFSNGRLFENPSAFDLLTVISENTGILWEIKTSENDLLTQSRRASEQLVYYDYFFVKPEFPQLDIHRSVVFEETPSEDISQYLESEFSIAAFSIDSGRLTPCNALATHLERLISRGQNQP